VKENPFSDEKRPFVSPSLNRARIVDLPGMDLPAAVKGKTGFELLSAVALSHRLRREVDALHLPLDTTDWPRAFARCFSADSPEVRAVAEGIACEYGRHVGYLLLRLKRGDKINRDARPDWEPSHWAYWRAIDTIWLGGGLVSGHLGRWALPYAQAILRAAGYCHDGLHLSPYAHDLPLVGAARYASPSAQAVLLFDFGHTLVKRACAFYEAGLLVRLRRLPGRPTPCLEFTAGDESPASLTRQVENMVELMANTWHEVSRAGLTLTPVIVASLACYMRQGQPYPTEMGCYGRLQLLANDVQTFFSARLSQELDHSIAVQLVHDATAAAAVYAGVENAAVLMLGTAIGIGFPPPAAGLWPLVTLVEVRP
jgi:hypothetical protein